MMLDCWLQPGEESDNINFASNQKLQKLAAKEQEWWAVHAVAWWGAEQQDWNYQIKSSKESAKFTL